MIMDAERLDRARAALKIMAERFPRAFTDPPRPLKVGVTKDLIPAVRDAVGARAVRDAIALYCRRPAYLKMQIEGATRVDLDGNDCGNVTADQAEGAKQRLEWKAARAWERALEKERTRRIEREARAAARAKKPAAVKVPEAKPERAVVVERKPKRSAIRSWRAEK